MIVSPGTTGDVVVKRSEAPAPSENGSKSIGSGVLLMMNPVPTNDEPSSSLQSLGGTDTGRKKSSSASTKPSSLMSESPSSSMHASKKLLLIDNRLPSASNEMFPLNACEVN